MTTPGLTSLATDRAQSIVTVPISTDRPDDYIHGSRFQLPPDVVHRLSQLSPGRSTLHIAAEWLAIALTITVCQLFWSWPLYVVAVALIGARQHALAILMHEGTHYRLFRSHKLNDCIANVFLAWPLTITIEAYRANHFAHHRFVNSGQDPDLQRKVGSAWRFPQSPAWLIWMVVKQASGIGFVVLIRELLKAEKKNKQPTTLAVRLARLGFYAAVVGAAVWAGGPQGLLLFWVVPFVTWFPLVQHIRSVAEHLALPQESSPAERTRTTLVSWLDRTFVAAKNINLHGPHHVHPSVPFFRLPALHEALMEIPAYRTAAHITPNGYWGVLKECARADGRAGRLPGP
jgi:fatty acid desaturase